MDQEQASPPQITALTPRGSIWVNAERVPQAFAAVLFLGRLPASRRRDFRDLTRALALVFIFRLPCIASLLLHPLLPLFSPLLLALLIAFSVPTCVLLVEVVAVAAKTFFFEGR